MKRIISLIVCIAMILTVAPVTIMAEGTTPDYTGGTLIGSYTLNSDFVASDLGKKVVIERNTTDEYYDVEYTNEGIAITRSDETATATDSKQITKFSFVLGKLVEDATNNTKTYQSGLSGIYAVEFTFNANMKSPDSSAKRTDFYYSSKITDAPALTSSNNFRLSTNGKMTGGTVAFGIFNNDGTAETTKRLVVDTINNNVYTYDVDKSGSTPVYTPVSSDKTYTPEVSGVLGSLTYVLRRYIATGSTITFKNIEIFEIEKDTEHAGNAAISALPATLTADSEPANAVTKDLVIPADWATNEYTVVSSDETVIGVDGKVTRGER